MTDLPTPVHTARLILRAETAADLMTANPVSIRADATVAEAVTLFTDRNLSAAPVIDEAGRPIGVLSRGDILVHDREKTRAAQPSAGIERGGDVADATRVRELMTQAVFSVTPTTPGATVIEEMVTLKVHQLFVVERGGDVVGVITAFDVLKHLHVEGS